MSTEAGWGDEDTASPASTPKAGALATATAAATEKVEVAAEAAVTLAPAPAAEAAVTLAPAPTPAPAPDPAPAPAPAPATVPAPAAAVAEVAKVEDVKEEADDSKQKAVDMEKAAADLAALSVSEEQYKKRLTVIQADPNSRLCAASKFEELNLTPEILKGIYEMGFDKPSKIQEHALPMILSNPPLNGVFQAQSGSGKTVAFTLGMLSRCDPNLHKCQALCVSPTRELAHQTMEVVEKMGKNTGMLFRRAMKGFEVERGTKINEHIIVGTPGRVETWLKKGFIKTEHFKIFVLDEADDMVADSSNKSRTKAIVTALPRTCQLLLFSATFPDDVYKYAKMILSKQNVQHGGKCNEIKIKSDEELILSEIKQFKMATQAVGKMQVLSDIYSVLDLHMSIIFVETKATADEITKTMVGAGFTVAQLHGGQQPEERDHVMQQFRQFKTKVLITTNVLARGVDVPGVNLVVNYDPPFTTEYPKTDRITDCETYLHRIGRCGRFGRKGVAISFINDSGDKTIYDEIESHFGFSLSDAPADDVESLEELIKAELDE
jgi:ATP-dependent RNA helicase DDX19/DBP5